MRRPLHLACDIFLSNQFGALKPILITFLDKIVAIAGESDSREKRLAGRGLQYFAAARGSTWFKVGFNYIPVDFSSHPDSTLGEIDKECRF